MTDANTNPRIERELPRLLGLAVRHAAAGSVADARKMVWALLRAAPDSAECWHALAAILYRQGNGTGAAVAVTRALEHDPGFSMSHALKADLLLCAGDAARACDHLSRALAQPDRLSPHMHRWATAMRRRLDRAAPAN